ncbi:hypothetical protein EV182_001705 [Spiromyces aspiralis]|uniref:Uncharacterized protein n=1 Tax=Spiromyces aspiralis TaxID=68401 RepID=A0ACC1HU93_9FUNG|nr:hypothetical protein EV182_001705 [Spiromyces aspiralis]
MSLRSSSSTPTNAASPAALLSEGTDLTSELPSITYAQNDPSASMHCSDPVADSKTTEGAPPPNHTQDTGQETSSPSVNIADINGDHADSFGDWVTASPPPSLPPRPQQPSQAQEQEPLPEMPRIRRSSTSSSKVQDAINEIIRQFDPLSAGGSSGGTSTNLQQPSVPLDRQPELKAQFQSDTEGFNYNRFLAQLRQPAAKPVARIVKGFLTEFARRPMTLNEEITFITDFFNYISETMRENSVWRSLPEPEFDNAMEGMEKLVMNRLFSACFSPPITDDSERDQILREKMSLFRWIKEEHLDISPHPQNEPFLSFARSELLKINSFKCPRDKLVCILNCCTVIFGLLKHAEGNVGADKFLPLLIYVVITANPPKLVSNVNYISRFRAPSKLTAESGYYFTNMMAAISFIESMGASCLSITKEDFDRNIEITLWEIETEKRGKDQQQQQQQQQQHKEHRRRTSQGHFNQARRRDSQGSAHHPPDAAESNIGAPFPISNALDQGYKVFEKGTVFAQKTLQKTNQFVDRLFSDDPNHDEHSYNHTHGGAQGELSSPRSSQQATVDPQQRPVIEGGQQWAETLNILRDMFPNVESEVCDMILRANNGFVPRTIEQLLEIATADIHIEDSATQNDDKVLESSSSQPQPPGFQSNNISATTTLLFNSGAEPETQGTSNADLGASEPKLKEKEMVDSTSATVATATATSDHKSGNLCRHSDDGKRDVPHEFKWADDSSEGEEDGNHDHKHRELSSYSDSSDERYTADLPILIYSPHTAVSPADTSSTRAQGKLSTTHLYPDTTGDEALARRLQAEEERLAYEEGQQRQQQQQREADRP